MQFTPLHSVLGNTHQSIGQLGGIAQTTKKLEEIAWVMDWLKYKGKAIDRLKADIKAIPAKNWWKLDKSTYEQYKKQGFFRDYYGKDNGKEPFKRTIGIANIDELNLTELRLWREYVRRKADEHYMKAYVAPNNSHRGQNHRYMSILRLYWELINSKINYLEPLQPAPDYSAMVGLNGTAHTGRLGEAVLAVINLILAAGAATNWFGLAPNDQEIVQARTAELVNKGYFSTSHIGTNDKWFQAANMPDMEICELNVYVEHLKYAEADKFFKATSIDVFTWAQQKPNSGAQSHLYWRIVLEATLETAKAWIDKKEAILIEKGIEPSQTFIQYGTRHFIIPDKETYQNLIESTSKKLQPNTTQTVKKQSAFNTASLFSGLTDAKTLKVAIVLATIGASYYMLKRNKVL